MADTVAKDKFYF